MKVRPEYFGWLTEQQERYGLTTPEEDCVLLEQALQTELRRKSLCGEKHAAFSAPTSSADIHRWNQMVLPLVGIGDDEFHFNEALDDGRTILDVDTLRLFDEADYGFQEETRKSEDPEYAGRPYRGSLYLSSARLRLDGCFTYATLSMAAGYIYSQLCNCSHELLEARVPFRYVRGRNHGKVKGRFWQWDMRVEADGQERVVEELQRRIWDYEKERFDALLTENDTADRSGVYLVDESTPSEASVHFVFADKSALSEVRFRSFVRDCRAMERPASELAAAVSCEKALLARFIDEQYSEVSHARDPKITRVREIRKVAITKMRARSA